MEVLLELEAIKRLKYRYMRAIDTKDWDGIRATLTPDCISAYDRGKFAFEGADAIVDFLETTLGHPGIVSMHQIHHPEIDFVSESRAKGRWYLVDYVVNYGTGHPVMPDKIELHGAAFYEDEYTKLGDEWRISRTGYERTFEQQRPLPKKGHRFRSRWTS
jgi:hypothetical protein